MIYRFTIFDDAIPHVKQLIGPSQRPCCSQTHQIRSLQEHPEKKRVTPTVEKAPFDSTSFRKILTRAEHECISRTYGNIPSGRRLCIPGGGPTLPRTRPIVCSVGGKAGRWLHLVVWNSFRPHERIEGGGGGGGEALM